ncbi:hypothetical protein L1049_010976 [Liquidambar formosana]|uniref:Uncharacterized protein n=1 Tax=Liquidambar formosana TaxID=63359 RepID=A0AAP0RWF0_LIQFO
MATGFIRMEEENERSHEAYIGEEGMDIQAPPTMRTNWTLPMDRYFIDLMLDQACRG